MCNIIVQVIGVIRVMALHLGVVYGSGGTVDSACDHVYDVSVNGGRYMCTAMCICIQTCSYYVV